MRIENKCILIKFGQETIDLKAHSNESSVFGVLVEDLEKIKFKISSMLKKAKTHIRLSTYCI